MKLGRSLVLQKRTMEIGGPRMLVLEALSLPILRMFVMLRANLERNSNISPVFAPTPIPYSGLSLILHVFALLVLAHSLVSFIVLTCVLHAEYACPIFSETPHVSNSSSSCSSTIYIGL